MNTLSRPRLLFLLAAVAPVILMLQTANVTAQTQERPPRRDARHARLKKRR